VLKWIACVAVLSVGTSIGASDAVAQGSPAGIAGGTPQIVASGEGEVRITPDRATITVGVQSRAATAAGAAADNARRQRAVIDTLRAVGVSGDDISTTGYNVSPEMQYSPTGSAPPRVTGYTVTNSVQIELRKLEDVGRVIDAALGKGANEISSLQLRSTKADSARRAALAIAVANAKADAEAMARAAGGSLGSLLELSSTSYQSPRMPESLVRVSAMAAKMPTPIEPGQQTVSVTVSARWAFVPR
jgi:uncharacterized protein YggE